MTFDSNSTHLCLDSCFTGGLTGFKSDFVEGSYADLPKRSSDATAGEVFAISEGIADCTLKDDNEELCTLNLIWNMLPQENFV